MANKLSANPSKTKSIIYYKKGRQQIQNLNVYVDGQKLERVKTTDIFRCLFDQDIHASNKYMTRPDLLVC